MYNYYEYSEVDRRSNWCLCVDVDVPNRQGQRWGLFIHVLVGNGTKAIE